MEETFVSPEETEEWIEQLGEESFEVDKEPEVEDKSPLSAEVLGLLYLGKLTKSFNFKGHEFVIKTLKIGEELEIALLAREFEDTNDYLRALATATVAATIESVDGKPLVDALGPSKDDLLQRNFSYVKERWYWPTIAHVYDQYVDLLQEQKEALDEFEKK